MRSWLRIERCAGCVGKLPLDFTHWSTIFPLMPGRRERLPGTGADVKTRSDHPEEAIFMK